MKKFQDLNLCDDFLFKVVMRDEKLLIGFLEMVLDLKGKIKGIKFVEDEKTVKNGYNDKGICLDVYVEDEECNVYNIEIQNGKFRNLPKRSRKYQSNLDGRALKPGENYDNLKKQYIIFICTGDPFGRGLFKYTFVNKCLEDNSLELGDGTTKIFLNTRGNCGSISKELRAFLDFVEKSTVQNAEKTKDTYVTQLSAKIEDIKRNEEIGGMYMTLEEKLQEQYQAGMKTGIEKGIEKGIEAGMKTEKIENAKKMKALGIDSEVICTVTGLSKEEIEELKE